MAALDGMFLVAYILALNPLIMYETIGRRDATPYPTLKRDLMAVKKASPAEHTPQIAGSFVRT